MQNQTKNSKISLLVSELGLRLFSRARQIVKTTSEPLLGGPLARLPGLETRPHQQQLLALKIFQLNKLIELHNQ